jgi:hypothetical protein
MVDGDGKVLWQGKCASTPAALAAAIRGRAPQVTRVGLESGPLSSWHWHELKRAGLPVICLDARHAKAALALQLNKSDRNDARGLAQIVRTGPPRSADRGHFADGSTGLLAVDGIGKLRSRASTASWSARCSPPARNWYACGSTSPTRSGVCSSRSA